MQAMDRPPKTERYFFETRAEANAFVEGVNVSRNRAVRVVATTPSDSGWVVLIQVL